MPVRDLRGSDGGVKATPLGGKDGRPGTTLGPGAEAGGSDIMLRSEWTGEAILEASTVPTTSGISTIDNRLA
ncbi:hypothetical protein Pa4123_58940 [Phytohabitans aurantiacus]|uniref:Uncharacterized protein n=1 Tax=Phytohabitans aurantiacus TaxID=3016789 RepID=A0ABQ5R319_9ACTN|nr:hypothetical protein Pa4123_58940 [Phytohabitans aurantiacus]